MAQTAPMSAESRTHLSDLERQRLRLEDQLEQLRKSLRHWQTWDAEYEGLKEEIQALQEKDNGEPSADQILAAGREFDGELVNEKEIRELLGPNQQRTAGQVIDVISRRQEYVQQNVATVQKQVEATEDRLNKVLIISSPSLQDEEGGPLMDIREELDEDGNVLTSSIHKAGESAPRIVEALRKAGITDLQGDQKEQTVDEEEEADDSSKPFGDGSTQPSPAGEEPRRKKSVTFTPDTKPPVEEKPAPPKPAAAAPEPVKAKSSLSSYANFKPGSRIVELDDDDRVVNAERAGVVAPVIPENETAEEAALRREMLEYSLNEVGSVVAELDLYDGTDDEDWEDEADDDFVDDDDDDNDDDEDEEMEEDEWGRSRPSVSADYVAKMRELESQLNARMMENVGPVEPADADVNEVLQQAQGFHRLRVQTDEQIPPALLPRASAQAQRQDSPLQSTPTATTMSPTAEKKVKFADEVDVAPTMSAVDVGTGSKATSSPPPPQPAVTPVSDAVIERNASSSTPQQPQQEPTTKRRPSRFKSSRAATPTTSTTPTPPTHATIASTILERPPASPFPSSSSSSSPSSDPDDALLSPSTLSTELLTQYHRARNTLISKQPGGFMAREGEATGGVVGADGSGADAGDLVEEMGDGSVRRVSRFKAARVRGLGEHGQGGAK
ncbi:Prefoldin subunit-domain-containing protein [Phyllosticta citrichinensis]|uniref:Prefoldin subunit-domain-containing protein n=1 Tax=Phyllosticta citrichinensis TaxID=1130410 RepID=A0ABR1XFQ0_9PEZI